MKDLKIGLTVWGWFHYVTGIVMVAADPRMLVPAILMIIMGFLWTILGSKKNQILERIILRWR